MFTALASLIATVLGELVKNWFAQHEQQDKTQKVIISQVQAQADAQTVKAYDARSEFKPLTAISLSNVPSTDPNFRD